MNSIPKKIHYCWFGGKPLPDFAVKCIDSWRKFFPDYEIIEWNESNYDVRKIPYISQAYEAKKYAFVSDYARFDILYQFGGIYFDTDVEVIKDMSPILKKGAFAGIESAGSLAAGLGISSPAATSIFKEILDSYNNESFFNTDGTYNLKTVVDRVSDIFRLHGFTDAVAIQKIQNIYIYPMEYFCPKDIRTLELHVTNNTYTIHHYDASWMDEWKKDVRNYAKNLYEGHGDSFFNRLRVFMFHFRKSVAHYGFHNSIKYWFTLLSEKIK